MNRDDRKPALLIIDDEANFRESLEMAMEDSFTVFSAGSLEAARISINENVPDAILPRYQAAGW